MKINPSQLKSLRIHRELSLKQLADKSRVSERQIARIESSESIYDTREYTAKRLADALNIDMEVLARNETLDLGLTNGAPRNNQRINPERLKELRTRLKLSRRKLAKRSGVSERQIVRIEDADTNSPVRPATLKKLADALDIDAEMLAQNSKHHDPVPLPPPQDIQLSIKVDSQIRLAYDLVKHRYGASQKDIINLAPLLYVLLAEGSLAWRKQWLEEAKVTMNRLEQLADQRRFLDIDEGQMEESITVEQESIERNDHLGRIAEAKGGWWVVHDHDSQFTEYLSNLSKELNISGKIDYGINDIEELINDYFGSGIDLTDPKFSEFRNNRTMLTRFIDDGLRTESYEIFSNIFNEYALVWGVKNYLICQKDLVEISGNSMEALFALVRGDVRIPEIPDELMTEPMKDKRVEWLESRMSIETKELAERYRELFAKVYSSDFGGHAR